ncbi:MAG: hypothetical protein P4L36_13650 [Holophaga sp.]|nr:hypothetical protein [Holophaga sp.]
MIANRQLCRVFPLLLAATLLCGAGITAVRPAHAPRGTEVTLEGTGLERVREAYLGARKLEPLLEHTGTRIRFTLPEDIFPGDTWVSLALEDGSMLETPFRVAFRGKGPTLAVTPVDGLGVVKLVAAGFGTGLQVTVDGRPVPAQVDGATILVKLPSGAGGFITVVDAAGNGASVPRPAPVQALREEKKVPATGPGRPSLSRFEPGAGDGRLAIAVHGAGLGQVTGARIGDVPVRFWSNSDDQGGVAFPPGTLAVSGPITLLSPAGDAHLEESFKVILPRPAVTGFAPARGRAGTWVAFSGAGLDQVASVSFGGAVSTDLQGRSPARFRVPVPSGALTGPVTLATVAGEVLPAGTFTLGEGDPLAYGIQKAYITQGIQDGSVPLVAGRPGVFRAFLLASRANAVRPRVRVRLTVPGAGTLLEATLDPPSGGVPTDLDEDAPGAYDLPVAGDLIRPGLALQTEIVRDSQEPPDTVAGPALAQDLEVKPGPTLVLRIVPLVYLDRDGRRKTGAVGPDPQVWRDAVMSRFPVRAVDFAVLPPLETGVALKDGSAEDMARLRLALETARLATPGARFQNWHGVFAQVRDDFRGLAFIGRPGRPEGRSSLGIDGSGGPTLGPEIMCHELAHTKGRHHNWCGTHSDMDPQFPDPPGGLGGAAYDVAAGRPLAAWAHFDLMGYCRPLWVGAYTYKGLLDFFLEDQAPARTAPAVDCLEVSGTLHGDAVSLEPALELKGSPRFPAPGNCTLDCLDARGRSLLKVPFAPQVSEDGEGESFLLLLPMTPAMKAGLAGLRVSSPGRRPALETRPARRGRAPVATARGAGRVAVTWDRAAWPLVLVRDPRSGAVLAEARGGRAEVRTTAGRLDLLLCDGVRSSARKCTVRRPGYRSTGGSATPGSPEARCAGCGSGSRGSPGSAWSPVPWGPSPCSSAPRHRSCPWRAGATWPHPAGSRDR